jgi:hypothetical protein
MNRPAIPLDQISVASPCNASWDEMSGNDRARFCGRCARNVYNLSGMTRPEAEALVRQAEGKVCVCFYRRSDGTVLTRDCPVGLRAARRQMFLLAGATAAFLFTALALLTTAVVGAAGVGWANGWRPRPLVWLVEFFAPAPVRPGAGPVPPLPVRGGPPEMVMGTPCPPEAPPEQPN